MLPQVQHIKATFRGNPEPIEIIFANLVHKIPFYGYRKRVHVVMHELVSVVTGESPTCRDPEITGPVFVDIIYIVMHQAIIHCDKLYVVLVTGKFLCR